MYARTAFLSLVLLFLPLTAYGQQTTLQEEADIANRNIDELVSASFGIHVDQDFFLDWWPDKNFDRNYTQGTAFSYTKPGLDKSIFFLPFNALEWVHSNIIGERVLIEYPESISFGVTAFTPLVIDSPTPVLGDRPFGSLVFFSTRKQRLNLENQVLLTTSLNYGLLGTNVANTIQSWIHRDVVKGRPVDISWEHQISRGGHFAFLFTHGAMKTILRANASNIENEDVSRFGVVLSTGYRVEAGWYTGIASITNIKIGWLTFTNLGPSIPDSFLGIGEKSLVAPMAQESPEDFHKTWEIYAFGTIEPAMIPHNSLVLGQPHVTSLYTLENEDYNPMILDLEYGLVIRRTNTVDALPIPVKYWELVLSINHRSPEIRNDIHKRWHHWGRVSLQFPLF